MTIFYTKNILLKVALITSLAIFLLIWSNNVTAQYASPSYVCYGSPIYLFCGGGPGCGVPGATYSWSDPMGSWTSTLKNPVIPTNSVGYHTGDFYLLIAWPPNNLYGGSAFVTVRGVLVISGVPVPLSCDGGNNGAINLTVSGGNPPYASYVWSNGASTKNISGLSAGTYTITVTDATGCTARNSWEVTQPVAMVITSSSSGNVLCNGDNQGYVNISVSGGAAPFTYAWSNGTSNKNASNLTAGTYTVTVTDATPCKITKSFLITQPSGMVFQNSTVPVNCNGGNNGSIGITASGGTVGYTYAWSNGGGNTASIAGLTSGNYTVTVTDGTGICTKTGSWFVNQPTAMTLSPTVNNISCGGLSNGSISITTSGGTPSYSYKWSNNHTASGNSDVIAGLSAGTYTVTVTDTHSCPLIRSWTITSPTALSLTRIGYSNPLCTTSNDGWIEVSAIGGVSGHTYIWNNGQLNAKATSLTAGSYTVTVTDIGGCKAAGSYTITAPSALSFVASNFSNVKCKDHPTGTIDITIGGGTGPGTYNYYWYSLPDPGSQGQGTPHVFILDAGTYFVTVSDANNCKLIKSWLITQPEKLSGNGDVTDVTCFGGNDGTATISGKGGTSPYAYKWITNSTAQLITGLSTGFYGVTISDNNGCYTFTGKYVAQPSEITINGSSTSVTCYGGGNGTITTTVSGGSPGVLPMYTYKWNNNLTTSGINNLTAGIYSVTVTDSHNCSMVKSFVVTENLPISITTASIIHAKCYNSSDGSIQVFATGGSLPYSYLWSNNQTNAKASNLAAGTYTVTISDAAMCTKVGSWLITAPSAMTFNSIATNLLCSGGLSGKIDISVTGGTPPYLYTWTVNANQGQGTAHVFNLSAGPYTITMTDSKLCTKTQSWVIIQPPLLVGNGSVTGVTCYGGNNGAASLSGAGGTPPYTYKWGIGPTAPQITGLSAGLYYATITDANLCTNVTGLTVTQPSGMTITAIPVLASCPGSSNGQITSNVSGGSGGPFNYQWNNGQSGSTAINLSSGSYTVTVTNGAGCKAISPPIYVGTANHLPDPAGIISGPAFVSPGQTGVVYTVPLIQYATGYNWNLPDGAGITDASPGSITVDFAIWATSGNLSVYGNNDCGSGATSPNLGITVVQMNLSLPTSTIGVGENNCYNATQTIYVGGGGKTFTVSSGGSATMIAGQNIVYLPGTAVTNEGYMHGFIATNGQYCIMPGNPVVNSAVKVGEVQSSVPDLIKNRHVRVYPNPMSESFTVELAGTEGAGMTRVDIYGMNGVKVLSATLIGERKHIFTAEHLLPGMYFLHITAGTTRETMKLIKM